MQVGMELLVCAVHPIPGEFYFLWTTKLSNHGGKIGSQENIPAQFRTATSMQLTFTAYNKHFTAVNSNCDLFWNVVRLHGRYVIKNLHVYCLAFLNTLTNLLALSHSSLRPVFGFTALFWPVIALRALFWPCICSHSSLLALY